MYAVRQAFQPDIRLESIHLRDSFSAHSGEKLVAPQPADPFPTEKPDRERGAPKQAVQGKTAWEGLDVEPTWRPNTARTWRLLHLMSLVAGAAVFLWLWRTIGPPLFILMLIALVATAVGGSIILARRRAIRQEGLFWIMAIAAENRVPLDAAVEAFAGQYRGRSHGTIMNLAHQLRGGISLPEALETKRNFAARDAVLLAWVGSPYSSWSFSSFSRSRL